MYEKKRRGDIEFDTLLYIIIGVVVLFLVGGIVIYLSGKGGSALDLLKNIFKFGT